MQVILKEIVIPSLVVLFKAVYVVLICYRFNYPNKKTRNVMTALSIAFPIITGIVCIVKYRRSKKDVLELISVFILFVAAICTASYFAVTKYYDNDGQQYFFDDKVQYEDHDGNTYTYNFDKKGYDYLYINGTEEYLVADLCYLDKDGYLVYDDDLSITAKDEHTCVDTDGAVYYPVKYSSFNKDGSIEYEFNIENFSYDRLGNAYVYDYVPYYDENGGKYNYFFDSATLKGTYTNVYTNEKFENEYSFVDENGYFVYDENHSFVRDTSVENVRTYNDEAGKVYYFASGVSWDKDGNLLDSYGKIIKNRFEL